MGMYMKVILLKVLNMVKEKLLNKMARFIKVNLTMTNYKAKFL